MFPSFFYRGKCIWGCPKCSLQRMRLTKDIIDLILHPLFQKTMILHICTSMFLPRIPPRNGAILFPDRHTRLHRLRQKKQMNVQSRVRVTIPRGHPRWCVTCAGNCVTRTRRVTGLEMQGSNKRWTKGKSGEVVSHLCWNIDNKNVQYSPQRTWKRAYWRAQNNRTNRTATRIVQRKNIWEKASFS